MRNLTVFCSGKNSLKQEYIDVTKKLIENIDEKKYAIVYGGANDGLMGVTRKTYQSKGGKIITSNIHKFYDPSSPDDYLFDKISDRQAKLIELGDIFLVLPGGIGTLFETFDVLVSTYIGEHSKEIVMFNYNNLYDSFIKQIEVLKKEKFLKHDLDDLKFKVFTEYEDVVNYLNNLE